MLGQCLVAKSLRQPAQGQPCLQLVGDRPGVDQLAQQPGGELGILAATTERRESVTPSVRIAIAQHRLQFATCIAHVVGAHRQRRLGRTHRQRTRRTRTPQLQCPCTAVVVVGEQGDAGCALGQAGVAVDAGGGLQVPVGGLFQAPGLERIFAGQGRGQGVGGRRCRWLRRRGQGRGTRGEQQGRKQKTERDGHRWQPGRKMSALTQRAYRKRLNG